METKEQHTMSIKEMVLRKVSKIYKLLANLTKRGRTLKLIKLEIKNMSWADEIYKIYTKDKFIYNKYLYAMFIINTLEKRGCRYTGSEEIQSIFRSYYENLYTGKLDKPEKTEEFLCAHHLPKLSPEDMNNLNRLITSN